MIKKVTVELTPFEAALLNQALAYYKIQVDVCKDKVEAQIELEFYYYRLQWLRTETAALQAKITSGFSSEQIELIQYKP